MKKVMIIILVFLCCMTLYAAEKPILSVLDFYTEEGISKSEIRLFISLLSSALFQTKIFKVIDVSERESILKELKYPVSGCSDESCQLEMGRLLKTDALVIGRVGKLGSRFVLSIKMLDTSTGGIINTVDGIYDTIDVMVDNVGTIANKLADAFIEWKEAGPGEEIAETSESETEETVITEKIKMEEQEIEEAEDIQMEQAPERKRIISFSAGVEAGIKFIIINHQDVFNFGIPSFVNLDLELNLGGEKLGIGLTSGVSFDRTKDTVIQPYNMITIPAGGNIKYESGFILPFFLMVEAMGGISFGIVSFAEEIGIERYLVIKPFAGIKIGAGYALTKNFHIAVCGAFTVIFTDDAPLYGIAPMIKMEMHF